MTYDQPTGLRVSPAPPAQDAAAGTARFSPREITVPPLLEMDYTITRIGGDVVYDATYRGRTPLNGGGANGTPLGRDIGRIWHRAGSGTFWTTPDSGNWSDLLWFGPFHSRRDAALFLVGMYEARRLAGAR